MAKREYELSVQCAAACHDLHAVCTGVFIQVETAKKPPWVYHQYQFECLCGCHEEAR